MNKYILDSNKHKKLKTNNKKILKNSLLNILNKSNFNYIIGISKPFYCYNTFNINIKLNINKCNILFIQIRSNNKLFLKKLYTFLYYEYFKF